jgi:heme A synthase
MSRFARYAWTVLGINLIVILWGAYVRASGSGAGCGAHWPLCNGVVVPRAPAIATIIELAHRVTSGLALLAVVGLVVGARRTFPPGHAVRRSAYASMFFILTEALVGAGLVLFEMVAHNPSLARGWWMSAHLINTFILLATLALTAWYASGARIPASRQFGSTGVACAALSLIALILGVSGAITALGDTLFPVTTLAEGFAQDTATSAHLFVRLRVLHPVLALAFGAAAIVTTRMLARQLRDVSVKMLAQLLAAIVMLQIVTGVVNMLLLAPIPLQIIHLLLADAVWITIVLFSAAAIAVATSRDRLTD